MKPAFKSSRVAAAKEVGGASRSRRSLWRQVGEGLSRWLWLLGEENLRAEAQRRTGLEDFGEPAVQPALRVLAESLEKEAQLHAHGRFLMRVHLRGLLETRLRLAAQWQRRPPEWAAAPLPQPLFILGMPRSGSTFLHELLTADPENRAPRVWEVLFPVGAPGEEAGHRDGRVRQAAACLWWFRRLAPGADSVYPMRAETPQECVAIQSYTFHSQEFLSTCRLPSYEAFLNQADLVPAYAWEKRFLQHLQWGCPARRWVLKSPDHVYGLAALFRVFPDARILHTHRNPFEVLRSSAQLTRVLQSLYSRPGNEAQVLAREIRVLAEGTERLLRFRDLHPELADRFVDVKYGELVASPVATVARIYRQLGLSLSEEASERMRTLAAQRHRYHHPRRPAANQARWTDLAAEVGRFERYCSRFDLPCRLPELES